MIESFLKHYRRSDQGIKLMCGILIFFLIFFLILIAFQIAISVNEFQYQELLPLLPQFISIFKLALPHVQQVVTILTVFVVVLVANRLIFNGNIIREDDRRQEIARTTHHLIAITKDLLVKVDYLKTILIEGGRPYLAITQLSKSIEDRYETLLQRDAYRYLPGECINIITRMSGSIFGIGCLADSVKQSISAKPESALITILGKPDLPSSSSLDNLIVDINSLIDQLFILRNSIDVKEGKK